MISYSTPNLPSRNLKKTFEFYNQLGFDSTYQSSDWLILKMHDIVLEFFLHEALIPEHNWFSCCIRTDDVSVLFKHLLSSGIDLSNSGYPRITAPDISPNSSTFISYFLDLDGNLLRLIQSE